MKNLFKSLMLVAVAAMAFTACSQDNNELNNLTKKTSIDFIASIGDDTRSGFGDKVGDKYVSKWDGLEDITAVAHTDSGDVLAYTTIDEEGKGEFTAEFETNDVITRVDFYTPSNSWMTWGEIEANLPQTQTPRANSVDPDAHILRGSIEVVNNEAQGHVNFNHEFAYGKMTLNLPEDFKVETVNLAFNGVDEKSQKLELRADNVENNVFWFTTIPMNVATFTVEATAKNGAIATKEVTVDKAGDLVFEQGHVSTFSVSNLDISLYDYEVILTKVIAINGNTISFEGENPQDRATIEFNTGLASIVAGTYSGVDASYGPGYSSNDALEFNYNGSTFNSSESYNSSYDMYFGSNDVVISDLGGDAIRVETVQKTWVSALSKSCRFRICFEGALDIEAPSAPTVISVTATLGGYKTGDQNFHALAFNLSNDDVIVADFRTNGNNYLTLGAYTDIYSNWSNGYYPGHIGYVYKNGTSISFADAKVEYADSAYTIMIRITSDWSVFEEYTYTGPVEGIGFPTSSEEPEPEPDPNPETIELTITSHGFGYTGEMETEIIFLESAEKQHVIDFRMTGIQAGSYTDKDNGIIIKYSKFMSGSADHNGGIVMSAAEAVITDNGNGTFTFDVTFIANGTTYHFIYTTPAEEGGESEEPEVDAIQLTAKGVFYTAGSTYRLQKMSDDSGNNKVTLAVHQNALTNGLVAAGNYSWYSSPASIIQSEFSFVNNETYVNGARYANNSISNASMSVDAVGVVTLKFTAGDNNVTFVCAPYVEPETLATPVVTATVNGNSITASWNAVTGAGSYVVKLNGVEKDTVTTTSYTFENLDYSTEYTISVVAKPANAATHKESAAGSVTVTTADDPNAGGGDVLVFEDWATSCTTDMTSITFVSANGDSITAKMSAFGLNKNIALSNIKFNGTAVDGSGSLKITLGNGDYIATFEVTFDGKTYKGAPHFNL